MNNYEGSNFLRQRIVLSCLSGKPVCIKDIRSKADNPGLEENEASFIRLIDSISNGSIIELNDTGTRIIFKPGILIGGKLEHNCPNSRGIGYILEPLMMLAPFCKNPVSITLKGVTDNEIDPTINMMKYSVIPILKKFFINDEELSLKLIRRGMPPLGGGVVVFNCPVIRNIKPFQWLDVGKVKKIRGTAFTCRGPPNNTNRIIEAAKGEFLKFLPDVYFTVDNSKSLSPGYGICVTAETTTGIIVSAEAMRGNGSGSNENEYKGPEDIGREAAHRLMHEIWSMGCVDSCSQQYILLFMVLASRDVSKVLVGPLTTQTMYFLRHLKDFFNVSFKIDEYNSPVSEFEEDTDSYREGSSKLVLTCLGVGFSNISKAQT